MGSSRGKRAGARRSAKQSRGPQPLLLGLALGVTLAVIAWGYLVFAAIDFGSSARGGDDTAWWFLALASVGAVACLFVALMLIVRILRALGITTPPAPAPAPRSPQGPAVDTIEAPRPPGGRRAAR